MEVAGNGPRSLGTVESSQVFLDTGAAAGGAEVDGGGVGGALYEAVQFNTIWLPRQLLHTCKNLQLLLLHDATEFQRSHELRTLRFGPWFWLPRGWG